MTPLSVTATSKPKNFRKVLLKTVLKVGKANHKIFIVDTNKMVSRDDVMHAIISQLQGDIVADDFDVGFVSGGNVISVRTPADILWSSGLTLEQGRKSPSGVLACQHCTQCDTWKTKVKSSYRGR